MATSNNDANDDELLTAYVDGVGELTPDERRAIELRLPELRAEADATRGLLAALRELPREGEEPVWADLANKISAEVGDRAPRAWWRRFLVPATGSILAFAAVAVLWIHAGHDGPRVEVRPPTVPTTAVGSSSEHPTADAPTVAKTNTVWLAGEAVQLDEVDGAALDLGDAEPTPDDDVIGGALMPTPDLAWIDDLDTDSLATAERWLVEKKGT